MQPETETILIVGGVAAGMKTAARLRRINPDANIIVIEQGEKLSYGACALPYVIAGEIDELDEVRRTPNGVIRDENFFSKVKGFTVMTRCEALSIDRASRTLRVRLLDQDKGQVLAYDKLVLATGGRPIIPPLPGTNLGGVFPLKTMEDADSILAEVRTGEKAVVVGGGLIGLEMAEALRARDMHVRLVEMQSQVLDGLFDADMAEHIHRELRRNGVELNLGEALKGMEGYNSHINEVATTAGSYVANMAILALGIQPNSELALASGLESGVRGAIVVNDRMQTSDPHIYAAGDCVETTHLLTRQPCYAPLGSTANKHGRTTANAIAGIDDSFPGILGTLLVKVFELNVGRTGLSEQQAKEAGFDPLSIFVPAPDKVHSMPTAKPIMIRLTADRNSRRLLGAQIIGPGDVSKRIDVVATALRLGATIDQVAQLDLGYAPHYSGAMDPLHQAANALRNKLDGLAESLAPHQLKELLDQNAKVLLLDVRSPQEAADSGLPGAVLLPLGQLRDRAVAELPKDHTIVPFCKLSLRGYEACRILKAAGFEQVVYLEGGMLGWPYQTRQTTEQPEQAGLRVA